MWRMISLCAALPALMGCANFHSDGGGRVSTSCEVDSGILPACVWWGEVTAPLREKIIEGTCGGPAAAGEFLIEDNGPKHYSGRTSRYKEELEC